MKRQFIILIMMSMMLGLTACDNGGDSVSGNNNQPPVDGLSTTQDTADDNHADEEKDHSDDANLERIELTDIQRERLDIQVAAAQGGALDAQLEAPATVRFDADRVARIGPRLSGKVLAVTKDLGESVAAGDTVAILDSVELGKAKAGYLTTAARYRNAAAEYNRDEQLHADKIVSEAELIASRSAYQQARAERAAARSELVLYGLGDSAINSIDSEGSEPLSRYRLTSPVAGIVQQRDLVVGQTVQADQTPIHIVDNRQMWVMIDVYEQALSGLGTGLPVELRVRPLPDQKFNGVTDWVSQQLDEQARTVRVRATIDNTSGVLRAGMFGTARIQTRNEKYLALVPIDAVQKLEQRDVVFVPDAETNAFIAQPVTLGTEGDGLVEIMQGLLPGDQVVVKGAFDLNSALTAGSRSADHAH